MQIFNIAAHQMPGDITLSLHRVPTDQTEWVFGCRLTNKIGTSYKEYFIRVYRYPDNQFATIGFNGRINGTLTPHLKYLGNSQEWAEHIANRVKNFLLSEKQYSFEQDTNRVPGKQAPGTVIKPVPPAKKWINPMITPIEKENIYEKENINKENIINEKIYNKNKIYNKMEQFDPLGAVTPPQKAPPPKKATPPIPEPSELQKPKAEDIPEEERKYLELMGQQRSNWYKIAKLTE